MVNEERLIKKKKEIINWLKQLNRLSTSRIMALLGDNYQSVIKYLDELEVDGLITREQETNATYWTLNKNE